MSRFAALAFLLLSLFVSDAIACPPIDGIPDFNCDGELKIVVIGDSFVAGVGDSKKGAQRGYVGRAARRLSAVDFVNLGKPGQVVGGVVKLLKAAFVDGTNEAARSAIEAADVVILDVGRNDRWFFGLPADTYKTLRSIPSQIRSYVRQAGKYEPLVVIAVLMLPNRGSQGPWVRELNSIILKNNSNQVPSDLRFDLVSKRLLSADQIHPTVKGYDALAKTFLSYLTKRLPAKMRRVRPDTDGDFIPDVIETERYGTSPTVADTDGDGRSDSVEIQSNTNPLVAD